MNKELILKKISKIGVYPYLTKESSELKYFVNYKGSNAYLLVLSPDVFFLYTDARYIEEYQAMLNTNIKLLNPTEDFLLNDILEEILDFSFKNLFIDFTHYTYKEVIDLQTHAKKLNIEILPLPISINYMRLIKTQEEIEKITKAQEINQKAFSVLIGLLKEGISEKDLVIEYEYTIKKQGADEVAFNPIILFTENSSKPHGIPSNRALKKGDSILIDAGVKYKDYCSDMTRTICFGEPQGDFKKHYHILLQIQNATLDFIKLTQTYAALDQYVRDKLVEYNLAQYFSHSLGHGIGIDIHEIPRIYYKNADFKISPNHIFTIEPGIYIPGLYGIRIEDMVYITPYGKVNIISTFPKDLLIF